MSGFVNLCCRRVVWYVSNATHVLIWADVLTPEAVAVDLFVEDLKQIDPTCRPHVSLQIGVRSFV